MLTFALIISLISISAFSIYIAFLKYIKSELKDGNGLGLYDDAGLFSELFLDDNFNDEQDEKNKQGKQETLGDRMKKYEKDNTILPYMTFMLRLDGKNFSTFTKGFQKPFDKNFTNAMVNTLNDLINFTNASTGFCCSDEISLIFPAICTKDEYEKNPKMYCHTYNGREIKLCTVNASRCSVIFNKEIQTIFSKLNNNEKQKYKPDFLNKIENSSCVFDCRVIHIPYQKEYECLNNLIWRSVYDCNRNAVSTYGRFHLGTKQCNNKDSSEMIKLMEEKNVNWNNGVPMYFKHGIYGKKELVMYNSIINGKETEYTRSKIKNVCFKIDNSEKFHKFLFSKYFNADLCNPYIEYE